MFYIQSLEHGKNFSLVVHFDVASTARSQGVTVLQRGFLISCGRGLRRRDRIIYVHYETSVAANGCLYLGESTLGRRVFGHDVNADVTQVGGDVGAVCALVHAVAGTANVLAPGRLGLRRSGRADQRRMFLVDVDHQLLVEFTAEGTVRVGTEVDALSLAELPCAAVDALVSRRRVVRRRQMCLHLGESRGRVAAEDALIPAREIKVLRAILA